MLVSSLLVVSAIVHALMGVVWGKKNWLNVLVKTFWFLLFAADVIVLCNI